MRKKHLKCGLLSVLIAALMIFSSAYIAQVLPSGTAVIAEAASKTVHISNCKIKLAVSSVTYNGKAQKPKVTVTYGKKTLKLGTHYTVKYSSNKNVGTAKVTVTGVSKNGYSGSKTLSFKIVAPTVKMSKCTVKVTSSVTYTGKNLTPTVKVTYGKKTLKKGTHYTVSYSSNRSIGTGKVTVTGIQKNGYRSSKTVTFNIVPQTVTGLKVSESTHNSFTLTWNRSPFITGKSAGYSVFSYDLKTKEYTRVAMVSTTKATVKNLKPGTTYRYVVRAYKLVNNKYYRSAYSPVLKAITRPAPAESVSISYPKPNAVQLKWNAVAGATGYQVYYYNPERRYSLILDDVKSARTYTLTNLDNGSYMFSVRPYRKEGNTIIYGELPKFTAGATAKITESSYKVLKYTNMVENGNYQMTFKTNVSELGGRTVTFAERNGMVAIETDFETNRPARIIYDRKSALMYFVIDGKSVQINDIFSSGFNVTDIAGKIQFPKTGISSTLEFLDKQLCQVNYVTDSNGNVRKFFFKGDELARIQVISSSSTTTYTINEFKTPADAGKFSV